MIKPAIEKTVMIIAKVITSSVLRRCIRIQNWRYPSSQKMSSIIDKGINIDDPDEIEKTLESEYNNMFQQSYLNHQQKINTPTQEAVNINNISEIENYEKLYLESFQAHELKGKVKQSGTRTLNPHRNYENKSQEVVGRIYLGSNTIVKMETEKIFTEAEIAGILAAKKTAELIPAHLTRIINKVELSITADRNAGEAEVRVSVDSEESAGVTEAMVACTTALVTLMDFGLKSDLDSDIAVIEIRLR